MRVSAREGGKEGLGWQCYAHPAQGIYDVLQMTYCGVLDGLHASRSESLLLLSYC